MIFISWSSSCSYNYSFLWGLLCYFFSFKFFNPHFHFWSLIFQLALRICCVLVYCSSLCFLAFVFSLFPFSFFFCVFELILNDCPYCLHLCPFSPSCLHFPDELICINRPVFHLSLCVFLALSLCSLVFGFLSVM